MMQGSQFSWQRARTIATTWNAIRPKHWLMVCLKEKKEQAKKGLAGTKIMVCTFHWKQNIGHFGKKVTVMGVHGPYNTMNTKFANETTDNWWNRLRQTIEQYRVNFLCGDFNMSLTQVVPRLRARGLKIDPCSWHPWLHEEKHAQGICLGMDSLAIFYIGGDVRCELEWGFCQIKELTRKAAVPCTPQSRPCRPQSRQMPQLHTYSGNDQPGQVWKLFKSKHNEKPQEADLQKKLRDLLQPSTGELRAYLRLR